MKKVFVITGAPGGGKTSIITELERRGFKCLPEESRILIKELVEIDSPALPWRDILVFNKLLLDRQIKQYLAAKDETCFLDRSFVDNIGYLKHSGVQVIDSISEIIDKYRFHNTVFFTEPWKEIYTKDSERVESFSTASKLSKFIKEAYIESGYEVVSIPKLPVSKRVDFILERI